MGPEQDQRRAADERSALLERSRYLLIFALIIYPGFFPLDLVVAPDTAGTILAIRLGVTAFFAGVLGLTFTQLGRRHIRPISLGFAMVASLAMVSFTALNGGFASGYYIGLIMILMGGCFFLPWSLSYALVFNAVSIAAYVAINLVLHGGGTPALPPVLFLLGTMAISSTATWVNDRARRKDQALRQELEQTLGELSALTEARSRFFANVSHELRTPLMLILGPLEELLDREAPSQRRLLMEAMSTNAHRLERQVELLLDAARLEAGRLKVTPRQGNIGQLLDNLVLAARGQAARMRIRLDTKGLEDIPDSSFDHHHLETIASNLLSNAMKFTPAGGAVNIFGWTEDGKVVFVVDDTGVGIPQDQLGRIFDRFHRVERPGEEIQGSGLGLAMVKDLVELSGGEISVKSREGKGSTFQVSLPMQPFQPVRGEALGPETEETTAEPTPTEEKPRERLFAHLLGPGLEHGLEIEEPPPESAPRLLVVEDNEDLRPFLVARLGRTWHVQAAADGLQAWEWLQNHDPPDLVITDVVMPHMDGVELLERIRGTRPLRDIPVIMLTARTELEDMVAGLESGADDYVAKPFHLKELEARIQALLRIRQLRGTVSRGRDQQAAVSMVGDAMVEDFRGPLQRAQRAMAEQDQETSVEELIGAVDQALERSERVQRMLRESADRPTWVFDEGAGIDPPTMDLSVVLVGPWLDSWLPAMASDLGELGVELTVEDEAGDEGRVRIDKALMRGVLETLILNARDAMTEAGRIWIQMDADETKVRIRVADESAELSDRLAQQLLSPESPSTPDAARLGIGAVRQTVKHHDGQILLESGTTGVAFVLRLPRWTG